MRLLVITANDIDQAGITFDQALPTEWLDAELAESGAHATAPGSVKARLSRSGKSDVVVRGECHAEVELPCARCLKPTEIGVNGELSLLLKARATLAPSEGRTKSHADAPRVQDRRSSRSGAPGAPSPTRSAAAPAAHRDTTAKAGKGGKAALRLAEYEFSSEEADLDEYDGETVVLDPFVREALLLELPNFPLCSDACPGISRTPRRGEAVSAEPVRVNPFEALKHLRPTLGSSPDERLVNGEADDAPPAEVPRPLRTAPKIETKIASTHAAPLLRPSAKQKRPKKGETSGKSSLSKRRKRS